MKRYKHTTTGMQEDNEGMYINIFDHDAEIEQLNKNINETLKWVDKLVSETQINAVFDFSSKEQIAEMVKKSVTTILNQERGGEVPKQKK
jgi:Na+/phosphate symporter